MYTCTSTVLLETVIYFKIHTYCCRYIGLGSIQSTHILKLNACRFTHMYCKCKHACIHDTRTHECQNKHVYTHTHTCIRAGARAHPHTHAHTPTREKEREGGGDLIVQSMGRVQLNLKQSLFQLKQSIFNPTSQKLAAYSQNLLYSVIIDYLIPPHVKEYNHVSHWSVKNPHRCPRQKQDSRGSLPIHC